MEGDRNSPEKSSRSQSAQPFPQGPPSYGAGPGPSSPNQPVGDGGHARPSSSSSAMLEDVLNPPPPSFLRPPQQNFIYAPFPTMVHLGLGATLDKGFPVVPPGPAAQPHPFTAHDVNEEDWTRFLGDLKRVGTLSPINRIVAVGAPIALSLATGGLGGGFFLTRIMGKSMRNKKSGPVSQLVDQWNHYFFHPRLMEVSLCRGHQTYSGNDKGWPADLPPPSSRDPSPSHDDSDSSSSSSESSDDSRHGDTKAERKARRAERKAERKAERRERKKQRREKKQERREQKQEKREQKTKPWRLVIVFRPLPGAPALNSNIP